MFRKFLIVAMFATAAGYCFAADNLPQVVTSEVYYSAAPAVPESIQVDESVQQAGPVWPIAGSGADVTVA